MTILYASQRFGALPSPNFDDPSTAQNALRAS